MGPAGSSFKLAEKIPCAVVLPKVINSDSKTAFNLLSFWDIMLLKCTLEEMRVGQDPPGQSVSCLSLTDTGLPTLGVFQGQREQILPCHLCSTLTLLEEKCLLISTHVLPGVI